MDFDADKVAALANGHAPFFEPGLDDLLAKGIESGRLRFTTSYQEAADFGDVHFVCVGTPQQVDSNAADLRFVDAVVEGIAPLLTRPTLVVGKSTVPVGTAERVAAQVAALAPAGAGAEVAWNPEFLREGHAIEDTLHPDRLVIGVTSDQAEQTLRAGLRTTHRQGCPAGRRRPRHLTAGEGGRQRVPGHQDLVHQRHGRAVRRRRRRRHAAVRRLVVRHPHRGAVPAGRARLRGRLPAQGHPRLHGSGRRARRGRGTHLPARGRLDQPPPSRSRG